MGVLNIIEGLTNEKSLTPPIIEVLLMTQPLTARQLFFKLKKRHGISVSYQAVHKRLQALQREGILKKEQREYIINPDWVNQIESFSSSVKEMLRKRENMFQQMERKKQLFEKRETPIKVISFDLGGTLFNNNFDELLWRTEIPKVFAAQHNITPEEAFERVTNDYRRLWGKVGAWRDPDFWLKYFNLKISYQELIKEIKKDIAPYNDATPIIKKLSKKYHLIIISHAQENILNTKLTVASYKKYFLKTYSTGTDFVKMVKDKDIYKEICEDLNIKPEEMVHVGSRIEEDYNTPSAVGINSFLIDRTGHKKDHFVVRDLYEFEEKVKELEAIP